MSIITTTPEQICRNPTNRSKSKMLYSFSKTPRFYVPKLAGSDSFYEVEASSQKLKKMNRFTCFGFGNKFDFTQGPKNPPPGQYEAKGTFDESKASKKGFLFGISREQAQHQGFIQKTCTPGPGAYKDTSQTNMVTCSMKGEHLSIINSESAKVPGPGRYNLGRIYEKNNILSNQTTHRGNSFSREKKLPIFKNGPPGPGEYQPNFNKASTRKKSLACESLHSKSVIFGKENRHSIIPKRPRTPGPGEYQAPSQFGQYLSKIAVQK